jgi:hypothetical protein
MQIQYLFTSFFKMMFNSRDSFLADISFLFFLQLGMQQSLSLILLLVMESYGLLKCYHMQYRRYKLKFGQKN